jgi:ATP-dependent protease HslVU (ClpYQ) peptidase subunit
VSLAVAIWESPTRYSVAADSLVTATHGEARAVSMRKVFRWGAYVGGWAGGVPAVRHLLAMLARQPAPTTREDVETGLHAAWSEAVPLTGGSAAGEFPRTGAYLVLAGPCGVVTIESYGEVIWTDPDTNGVAYEAVGASDYAIGWLDAHGGVSVDLAARAVRAAIQRYPSVGGAIDVLGPPERA